MDNVAGIPPQHEGIGQRSPEGESGLAEWTCANCVWFWSSV